MLKGNAPKKEEEKLSTIEDDAAIIEKAGGRNSGLVVNRRMSVPIGNTYKTRLMQRLNLL